MTNPKPQVLLAGGAALVLMSAASFIPIITDRVERGAFSRAGLTVAVVSLLLMAVGATSVIRGRRRATSATPRPVRVAITVTALVLAFLTLELSDRLVRQEGNLRYWTTWLLVPAILLLGGLIAARPWSWWIARGATAIGVIWFAGFLVLIPFAPITNDGVPAPLHGRVYMATVTLAFAAILTAGFRALGRVEARSYFGVSAGR